MKTRLIGSRFKKISCSRDPDFSGKIEMEQNIKINDIKEYDKKNSIVVDYSYTIDFKDLGNIEIGGTLYIELEGAVPKKVIKDWKAKALNNEEQLSIINLIVHKASVKALQLEDELGLPIHFRLPTLQGKKE